MDTNFERLAGRYHDRLPGIVRATLNDYGITDAAIDRHLIGWDDECVTIPVRNRSGMVAFFERWRDIGVPYDEVPTVELFPWETLLSRPEVVVYCEGVLECLAVESAGLPAICATGSGRYFKKREWADDLAKVSTVLIALKRGDKRDRRRGSLWRSEVAERIAAAVTDARIGEWPANLGDDAGAVDFLLKRGALKPWLRGHIEPNV